MPPGEWRALLAGVGDGERGPLAEGAAVGCEGQRLTGGDQLPDPLAGELDDEVPGCSFDAGEEGAVRTQAGVPHHGALGDVGFGQELLCEPPEQCLAGIDVGAVHGYLSGVPSTTMRTPGCSPAAATWPAMAAASGSGWR
jgi:hypothetical protein